MRRWLSHEQTLALHMNWDGVAGRDMSGCDEVLLAQFHDEQPWGIDIAVDLCACNLALLSDPAYIRVFVEDLCEKCHVRREGELSLTQHREAEHITGYTLVQVVQSAHLVAHFIFQNNAMYVSLVTCAFASPIQCAVLCQQWFAAQHVRLSVVFRGLEHARSPSGFEGPGVTKSISEARWEEAGTSEIQKEKGV